MLYLLIPKGSFASWHIVHVYSSPEGIKNLVTWTFKVLRQNGFVILNRRTPRKTVRYYVFNDIF